MGIDRKALAEALFGPTEKGHCVTCKNPVYQFRDALSEREYEISHMCQSCQDSVFHQEDLPCN